MSAPVRFLLVAVAGWAFFRGATAGLLPDMSAFAVEKAVAAAAPPIVPTEFPPISPPQPATTPGPDYAYADYYPDTSAYQGYAGVPVLASVDETMFGMHAWFEKDFHEPTLVHIGPQLNVLSVDNDDCSGFDRDPCPYMGSAVPKDQCWDNPDPTCESVDLPYCACPVPRCNTYCGTDNCPNTY